MLKQISTPLIFGSDLFIVSDSPESMCTDTQNMQAIHRGNMNNRDMCRGIIKCLKKKNQASKFEACLRPRQTSPSQWRTLGSQISVETYVMLESGVPWLSRSIIHHCCSIPCGASAQCSWTTCATLWPSSACPSDWPKILGLGWRVPAFWRATSPTFGCMPQCKTHTHTPWRVAVRTFHEEGGLLAWPFAPANLKSRCYLAVKEKWLKI